nr:sialidase family protein [uncultured Pseudomonas sp.]
MKRRSQICLGWLALLLLSCLAQPALAGGDHGKHGDLAVGLASGPDGVLYAALVEHGHIQIQRSEDDGNSWQAHAQVNRQAEAIAADGENHPQLAVGADGTLYVSWARRFEQRFTGDVRFARAENGRDFSAPVTVHRDRSLTGHSFQRMHLAADGRLQLIWIDGRERLTADATGRNYSGSALYATHSDDGGRSFVAEYKLADHSCQCCRLALAEDNDGSLLLMWRQVFANSERDHALLRIPRKGAVEPLQRATFDAWQIDACPHHGPSLAVDGEGRRHATWFSPHGEDGPVFYGRLAANSVQGQRAVGGPRAAHASVASLGQRVVLLWKEFDGEQTQLLAEISDDGGRQFRRVALASSDGPSDHPRLLRHGQRLLAFWHNEQQGLKGYPLP